MKANIIKLLPPDWEVIVDDPVLLGVIIHQCDEMSNCIGCLQECGGCGAAVPETVQAFSDFVAQGSRWM